MSVTLRKTYETTEEVSILFWTYPAGERGLRINLPETYKDDYLFSYWDIQCDFKSSDDIMDVLLLVNAIRHQYNGSRERINLDIDYFPYARQDRVMTPGEPFALQAVCSIFNLCKFERIYVKDVHSDVIHGLFEPGTLINESQEETLGDYIQENSQYIPMSDYALVAPDAGALKKVYKLSKKLGGANVVLAAKTRNLVTGDITGVSISAEEVSKYKTLYIVDDICDGGKTFVELGKEIRKTFTGSLVLVVTHGIFSKGQEVFEGIFDAVHAVNNMEKK